MLSTSPPAPHSTPAMSKVPLLKQELEVVALVVEGLKDEAISARLGIGLPEVRHIISSAQDKLNASDRLELVIHAIHYGAVARP